MLGRGQEASRAREMSEREQDQVIGNRGMKKRSYYLRAGLKMDFK